MPFSKKIKKLLHEHKQKNKYYTKSRLPFYDLVGKYINEDSRVIDIGAGMGKFAEHLAIKNITNLDSNPQTCQKIKNTVCYSAPDRLPFSDEEIDLAHCSHLIEHLSIEDALKLLKEIDRVLKKGALMTISAPLFGRAFFEHPTHKNIFSPKLFIDYLCNGKDYKNAYEDKTIISQNYTVLDLVYRYGGAPDKQWGSKIFMFDLLIKIARRIIKVLRFRQYAKTGYTIILQKAK